MTDIESNMLAKDKSQCVQVDILTRMQNIGSDISDKLADRQSLATADAVARAAHLWIRSLCCSDVTEADERFAMAAGLVAGLCERLELNPMVRELVAYVYALLDDEGAEALAKSRAMLDRPTRKNRREAFERGRSEAAAIIEMLAYQSRSWTRAH